MIAALADLSLPPSCHAPLHQWLSKALDSAPASDFPPLIRCLLRSLPSPRHSLPLWSHVRRLSLTFDPSTTSVLLSCVTDPIVNPPSITRVLQAIDEGRESLLLDVLILVALSRRGKQGDRAWEVFSSAVKEGKLGLRRLREALSPPWLDVLTSHVPAVAAFCQRLLRGGGELSDWAGQVLPHLFLALPSCQPELRGLLLSACSKSYVVHPTSPHTPLLEGEEDERVVLFHRAEVASSILLSIASTSPAVLYPHYKHVETLLDYPDSLYPVVLHRLSLCVALVSPVDGLMKDCRKMLTMGHPPAKKTALILAGHLIRATAGTADERSTRDGLIEYACAVLEGNVAAVAAEAMRDGGFARHDRKAMGWEMGDSQYTLDGHWNLACIALDLLSYAATHSTQPSERLQRLRLDVLRPTVEKLKLISQQVNHYPTLRRLTAGPCSPLTF